MFQPLRRPCIRDDSFFQHDELFNEEIEATHKELVEPQRFEREYNHCQERSFCGDDDHDKDNGLDSTLSISMAGDHIRSHIHERYGNRAMSHCGRNDFPLHQGDAGRNLSVLSQYNKKEMEEQQDHLDIEMLDSPRGFDFKDSGSALNIRNR